MIPQVRGWKAASVQWVEAGRTFDEMVADVKNRGTSCPDSLAPLLMRNSLLVAWDAGRKPQVLPFSRNLAWW